MTRRKEKMGYKKYVKSELIKKFEKLCKTQSLDSVGCSCLLSLHYALEGLMKHTYDSFEKRKLTPKEAWEEAMNNVPVHSGVTADAVAGAIVKYSPRGEEFKTWYVNRYKGHIPEQKNKEKMK